MPLYAAAAPFSEAGAVPVASPPFTPSAGQPSASRTKPGAGAAAPGEPAGGRGPWRPWTPWPSRALAAAAPGAAAGAAAPGRLGLSLLGLGFPGLPPPGPPGLALPAGGASALPCSCAGGMVAAGGPNGAKAAAAAGAAAGRPRHGLREEAAQAVGPRLRTSPQYCMIAPFMQACLSLVSALLFGTVCMYTTFVTGNDGIAVSKREFQDSPVMPAFTMCSATCLQ